MGRGEAAVGKAFKGMGVMDASGIPSSTTAGARDIIDPLAAREAIAASIREEYERVRLKVKQRRLEMSTAHTFDSLEASKKAKTIRLTMRLALRDDKRSDLISALHVLANEFSTTIEKSQRRSATDQATVEDHEGQVKRTTQAQAASMDQLLAIWNRAMQLMTGTMAGFGADLEKQYMQETMSWTAAHKDHVAYVMELQQRTQEGITEVIEETDQVFQGIKEALRNKYLERVNNLRLGMGGTIDTIEALFDQEHARYVNATNDRTKDFQASNQRDIDVSEDICQRMRRAEALHEAVQLSRKKIHNAQRVCSKRNKALREQKNRVVSQYNALKVMIIRKRNAEAHISRQVAKHCLEVRQHYGKLREQAEHVIEIAETTRTINVIDGEGEMKRLKQRSEGDEVSVLKALSRGPEDVLARFRKKHAQMQLQNQMLIGDRDRLRQDNVMLKNAVRAYVEEITLPEGYVEHANSLFVVNGRDNRLAVEVIDPWNRPAAFAKVESGEVMRQHSLHNRPVM